MRHAIVAFLLSFSLMPAAERVSVPVENDQVRVVDVTVQPREKTRLHEHKMNRVMIYLDKGSQHFEYQGKGSADLSWRAGEPKWSPAAGMHTAEITSDTPIRIIEIELKKPAGARSPVSSLDPVRIDAKHYRTEIENDQVRVVRVKIAPGETAPMHEHSLNRVTVYLTPQDFRVTGADGKVATAVHKAGDVSWGAPSKHSEMNAGKQPFEVLMVELK
jgi:quercetin dioxygenase-like cupin family protein